MEFLSKKMRDGIAKLNEKFIAALPFRLKEILEAMIAAADSGWKKDEIDYLRLLVHRLAGSGSTFGCEELSLKSKEIEQLLDQIAQEPKADPLKVETIHALFDEIREEYSPSKEYTYLAEREEEPETETMAEDDKITIICLIQKGNDVFNSVFAQLGFFGYQFEMVSSLKEVREHLVDGGKQLLIVDPKILEDIPDAEVELNKLKMEFSLTLSIIFISEKDGFDIRLRCVRAGGFDFFVMPIDVVRVIDRIDELTSEVEGKPYHILIVDDDIEQLSAYAMMLQQAGMITSVASDPTKVLSILSEAKPDLIIMDLYMPGCNGTELASVIRQEEAYVSIPIVFLSIETDEARQLDAVRFGGDDFIVKSIKPEHLISSIRTRVERTRRLRYHMERDSLTGLYNHSNLKEQLRREVLRAERMGTQVCFAMIDLDLFKNVNDTYGHLAGDKVLKSLCRLLQERLRRTDIIGRYGGEELGIVLINTNQENAGRIMNQIRETFSVMPHQSGKNDFFVTFSCGISSFPDLPRPGEIISEADKALYCAKENGRNQVVLAGYKEKL